MHSCYIFNYRDAIQMALEKRNILLDKVNVFVAQSKTPLPLQAECSFLGGSHVHVRGKMKLFDCILDLTMSSVRTSTGFKPTDVFTSKSLMAMLKSSVLMSILTRCKQKSAST